MINTILFVLIMIMAYYLFVFMPDKVLQYESDVECLKHSIIHAENGINSKSVMQNPTDLDWSKQIDISIPNKTIIMPSENLKEIDHLDIEINNGNGDNKLTAHVSHNQKKSKQSMDNRSMWSKNSLIPYLEEELKEHANSRWWDDDSNLESRFIHQSVNVL